MKSLTKRTVAMLDEAENLETPGIDKLLKTTRESGGDPEREKKVRDQLEQWEEEKDRKLIEKKKSN